MSIQTLTDTARLPYTRALLFPRTTTSAMVSTRETMANEGRSASLSLFLPSFLCSYVLAVVESFTFLVRVIDIRMFSLPLMYCNVEAKIVKIAPTEKSKFRLTITAGNKKHKAEEIYGGGAMPKWTVNMSM